MIIRIVIYLNFLEFNYYHLLPQQHHIDVICFIIRFSHFQSIGFNNFSQAFLILKIILHYWIYYERNTIQNFLCPDV